MRGLGTIPTMVGSMDDQEAQRLRDAGFGVGTVQELANLSDAAAGLIEISIELVVKYRARLKQAGTTTAELIERGLLGADAGHILEEDVITVDALIEGLLAVGATFEDIGKTVAAVTLPTV